MSSASLSFPHRTTARVILSFAVLLMSGVVALASGSTAKRATKRNNASSRRAALMQLASPTISKFFFQDAVAQNGTFSVDFSISNPNGSPLTGLAFTDSLPAGMVVATPNGLSNSCGGTATATAGSSSISLTGGTLDPAVAASCDIFVTLQATGGPGTLSNTTGAITSNESNPGNPSNTATIEVIGPPTITKSFGAASIPVNGTTTLSFTITNPNTTTILDNLAFTDTLPSGLVVATPNGLTGTCVDAGGAVTATPGSNSINLLALSLAASASCSFSVNVTGTTGGLKSNITGNVSGTFTAGEATLPITGGTASAMTTVVGPPTISKAFANPGVQLGGTTTLTFTLTNPNPTTALTGVAFSDTFPAGLAVAGTPNVVDGCGGTFTAPAAATSVSLTGGTIAAASSCVISVSVQVTAAGFLSNTTGPVSSTNGGTGSGSNTATVGGFDTCVKDDATGAILQWSSTTGAYTFTDCKSGFTISGTGTPRNIGGTRSLTDVKPDRRISGNFLTNQMTGNAAVTVMVAPGIFRTFNLRQTNTHAICSCP